jgi:phosphatidylglycerophosphatase A
MYDVLTYVKEQAGVSNIVIIVCGILLFVFYDKLKEVKVTYISLV